PCARTGSRPGLGPTRKRGGNTPAVCQLAAEPAPPRPVLASALAPPCPHITLLFPKVCLHHPAKSGSPFSLRFGSKREYSLRSERVYGSDETLAVAHYQNLDSGMRSRPIPFGH